jgi:SAM-dependent methyltransferase
MRREFVELARCPVCHAERSFDVEVAEEDGREVRAGSVRCRACGTSRGVDGGIVDLMPPDPPDFVRREAAGLERFAQEMRNNGWDRERVLNLPYEQSGYWYAQGTAMHQTLANVGLDFQPGKRLLDVGSNTCWASATFAERELEVVALDIADVELQGLAVADWWFEGRDVYFDRVLGLMFDLPIASDSLDYVWCCEVLHHNHRENLWRTMGEIERVLKPGGRMIVVNESVRALRTMKLRPGHEVAQYEGHEHAYLRRSYVKAARDAGLEVELVGPWIHPTFTDAHYIIKPEHSAVDALRSAGRHGVRRSAAARRAVLAWKNYVTGTALYMIGTKPG